MQATTDYPVLRLEPSRGFLRINLRAVWEYRELLYFLVWRDIKVRYKQTALGVVWVVAQPLVAAVIFAVVFGRVAKLPSDGAPYLLFVFCGVTVWTYFSQALQRAGTSLVRNSQLVSKVYFPKLLIPLAQTLRGLVDFAVILIVLAVLLLALPVRAQDGLVTYKSLSPELALELARASLAECRKRGYQAAIAVVDRFGVTQVMLRDRFAGAHTPATAAGKAWTAASFRTSINRIPDMRNSRITQRIEAIGGSRAEAGRTPCAGRISFFRGRGPYADFPYASFRS
jgi:hypothetical protein